MFGASVSLSGTSNARQLTKSAIGALAVGAMLGALVAVPYDQVFGLSAPLCTALRSSIATVILTGIKATDSAQLTYTESDSTRSDRPRPWAGPAELP